MKSRNSILRIVVGVALMPLEHCMLAILGYFVFVSRSYYFKNCLQLLKVTSSLVIT